MRLIFAIFAIFSIIIVLYFDRFNPETVTINLSSDYSYTISMVGFFLFSFALGSFIVILFTLLRDAKNIFVEWRNRQRQKVEVRIQETFSKGLNAYLSGRYDQAISYFRDIIKIEPNHYYTLLRIGDAYQQERNYSEAIKYHKKATKVDEKSLEARFALANDYLLSASYDEAIAVIHEVINKDASNIEALVRLRDVYITTGKWDGAHEMQGRVVKRRRDNIEDLKLLMGLRYEFAKVLSSRGEREKSKKLLKGIIRADKDFIPAYVTLGDILIEEGDGAEAVDLWGKGYYMNFSEILLHKLEDFHLQLGEPGKIIWVYKKAISMNPQNAVLKFYLGKLYYRLEMIDEAFDILAELDGIENTMPDLYKLLGTIYERKEELGKAVAEYKRALGLRKRVVVPYFCPLCDCHTYEWSGRCPRCGAWNSFTVSPVHLKKESYPAMRNKFRKPQSELSYKDRIELDRV
ncbi:MAG TPA: tetratricopeptide repeat protein [Nitrospirota bacterium]|nr:tetratricopeptide repeat protein [Nitrospirota bacterium]